MNLIQRYRKSSLSRALKLLSRSEKRKIVVVMVFQTFLAGIDLLAVALVGILGSMAVAGVSSQTSGGRIAQALSLLNLESRSFQEQAAILAVLAATLLTARTLLSVIFARRVLYFLARRAAVVSTNLLTKLLSQSLLFIQSRTTQQTLYSLTHGVSGITLGIIGTAVSVVSDSALLLVMFTGLFVVDPATTTGMIFGVSLLGVLLYKVLHKRAQTLGVRSAKLDVDSNEKIVEVFNSYREAIVRNRRSYYAHEIGGIRHQLADTQAESAFLPSISKYVVELAVVFSAIILGAIQFYTQDARQAVATLAIFLVAGSRIAPAALRLQQSALQLRITMGVARPTLDLIDSLDGVEVPHEEIRDLDTVHEGFNPEIIVKDVTITYPGKTEPAVSGITFSATVGSTIAVVGPSGAGKTTLIDVILGVIKPQLGTVEISGLDPQSAINKWPGAIAYVPQDVLIVNGTISHNIALGYKETQINEELVSEAVNLSKLADLVSNSEFGLMTQVGDRGSRLSGGQRQRLGIARALYTKPKLIVFDEATSALDGQTELDISESIQSLKGSATIILIAHRLSTVRKADTVIYLDRGRLISSGTFESVRREVPDFDHQAKLMGL